MCKRKIKKRNGLNAANENDDELQGESNSISNQKAMLEDYAEKTVLRAYATLPMTESAEERSEKGQTASELSETESQRETERI